jgi:hypothetical protein
MENELWGKCGKLWGKCGKFLLWMLRNALKGADKSKEINM